MFQNSLILDLYFTLVARSALTMSLGADSRHCMIRYTRLRPDDSLTTQSASYHTERASALKLRHTDK